MPKSPQRARHASKSKPVVRQRKNGTPASESPRPDDAAFVKTDVTPEDFFKAWSREDKEALVDILIHSFDEADGYSITEMEEDDADPSDATLRAYANPASGDHEDDEPTLGTTDHFNQTNAGLYGRDGWTAPTDLELDDADDEPYLGSAGFFHECNPYFNQQLWAYSNADDREGDPGCDDKEPSLCGTSAGDGCGDGRDLELDDSDMEPSLGWTTGEASHGRAYAGAFGRCFDLEEDAGEMRECDPAEAGIADMDGYMEQCAGHRAVNGHWSGIGCEPYVS